MGSSSTHHITSNRDNRRLQRSKGGSFKLRHDAKQQPVVKHRSPSIGRDRIDYARLANSNANDKVAIYAVMVLLFQGMLAYLI